MEKSNDEAEDELTLLYLKENLDLYCSKKLKILACILNDSICELATEKDFLSNNIDICQN